MPYDMRLGNDRLHVTDETAKLAQATVKAWLDSGYETVRNGKLESLKGSIQKDNPGIQYTENPYHTFVQRLDTQKDANKVLRDILENAARTLGKETEKQFRRELNSIDDF